MVDSLNALMGGPETIDGVTLRWATSTDVGNRRTMNEDLAIARPPVFVVADGMGGHQAGDVASRLAIEHFSSLPADGATSGETIVEALRSANHDVYAHGHSADRPTDTRHRPMGTTVTGLALVDLGNDPNWMIFNIGDSRVYRLDGGKLELLSKDHSYVQELVDAGALDPGAARSHPNKNVVTRAVGVDVSVEPDIWIRPPEVGERFMLCSDGLSGEIEDELIATILDQEPEPATAASRLIAEALRAGGSDNVTVVVVDVLDLDFLDLYTTAPRDDGSSTEADPSDLDGPPEDGPQESVTSESAQAPHEVLISGVPGHLKVDPDADGSKDLGDGPGPTFDLSAADLGTTGSVQPAIGIGHDRPYDPGTEIPKVEAEIDDTTHD